MPEAGLNCIVSLRKETKTPQCPATLIRTGRLEERPGDSATKAEAKLLAQRHVGSWIYPMLFVLNDAAQQQTGDMNGLVFT